jgi:hypothetical protein
MLRRWIEPPSRYDMVVRYYRISSEHGSRDMDWINRSDMILMSVAAYVAVMSLVRLMRQRRDQLVVEVQRQVDTHRKKRQQSDRDIRGAA